MSAPLSQRVIRLAITMGGARLRTRLYRRVIIQMSAGRPIKDVMAELAQRSERRHGHRDPVTQMLIRMAQGLRNGRAIAPVFADWVPKEDTILLAIGEATGRVPDMLRLIITLGQSHKNLTRTALKGLISPVSTGLAALGMLWYLSAKVMPVFKPLLKGHALTGLGALIMNLSHVIRSEVFVIGLPAVLVLSLVGFLLSLPRWTGRLRRLCDRFPPWSFYRRIQGALWLSSFAALSQAGMQEKDAMEQMMKDAVPYVRERLQAARNGLLAGRSVGEALANAHFLFPDSDTLDDLAVMANYPDYSARMAELSQETMQETEEAIALSTKSLSVVMQAASSLLMIGMVFGIFSILQTLMASVSGT
ncbi:type II secretion system F family protein [Acidiferrobacter sp.]|uniref:type II secretion system F family protein n=1 Tax=Acidiferrobacter sp. TaxID=1872107 RepID=UPI002630BBAF|nr:type II secretion system F family protein [Acidiferrobacter sp.]